MANTNNVGSFVPTTYSWEIQQLQSSNIDPAIKNLLIQLYQNINAIVLSLNTRDSGYYVQQEFVNGQIYFPSPALNSTTPQSPTMRQVFRTVVNFGVLPNATVKAVPHNIDFTNTYSFTRIYGAATDPLAQVAIPIPLASATLVDNIEIGITATDVEIITSVNYSGYTTCFVVLEYIKQ